MMIDLHTHSLLSDGVLLPSELVRRAEDKGVNAIGITDHIDSSNVDIVIPQIVKACKELNKYNNTITAIAGAELTHIHPKLIKEIAQRARDLGAVFIVMHGETIAEPVKKGTNIEAIKAGVDILAHPGLISKEEADLAKKNSVYLEISGRQGHSLTNGHVVKTALKAGAKLIFNTDAHIPSDLIKKDMAIRCIKGAGAPLDMVEKIIANSEEIVKRLTMS